MENNSVSVRLVGSEINGFRTMEDLDVHNMMEEAKARWLRPNEIHAILCNHKYFTVNVKPVNLPKSGTIVLFDRKMLRNFRKDGHNWKKKNDGKTVKEAHEHLKVGNEERIHVYYAHGEDNPTFVRRCYWLLDKSLEHIVLVHYRDTQEGTPAVPVNSNSSPAVSGPSAFWRSPGESNSAVNSIYHGGSVSLQENNDSKTIKYYEQTIHEINTLEWDDLLVPDDFHNQITQQEEKATCFELPNQFEMNSFRISDDALSTNKIFPESTANYLSEQVDGRNSVNNIANNLSCHTVKCEATTISGTINSGQVPLGGTDKEGLQTQDSFERWITSMIADSPETVDDQNLEPLVTTEHQSFTSSVMDNHRPSTLGPIFNITDVSPSWALSTEETKILVVGFFKRGHIPSTASNIFLACGDSVVQAEVVQGGVFRCLVSPQTSGLVNLYLTFDGHTPISQILTFEFRSPILPNGTVSNEDKSDWKQFQLQMRLAHLLFSASNSLNKFSTKLSHSLTKAKAFMKKTSYISDGWACLSKMVEDTKMPFPHAKDSLFELTLQNRLQEWLLEKVVTGCKISERDEQGQGVIHLCAILGYTWAVIPFSCSGLSLDYRDKFGWTALHWAAYYGREKMVAALLSAGAKPNLVTDPTSENPGGSTASDLASRNGYDGLAAYLAEKALITQFIDMTLAGNVSGSLQTNMSDAINPGDFNEDEMYLKDTLAAYRTAADAAARIHAAFREHELKVRTKAAETSNPEMEARNIIAAMKIQHAFRSYEKRKKMAAAVRIQYRFRTWKMRKDFLNMRRQAIKIQAVFRGFQARRQYRKIVWSVGILEKAILRWRLKRKGFRGLQVDPVQLVKNPNQDSDIEDDFFHASRKQAEERVERSVVKVQAMFRSRQAQQEYRRMKLEHSKAKMEYEELVYSDTDMG